MKSGLEDRNNNAKGWYGKAGCYGLNEVRPGRPEQLAAEFPGRTTMIEVSMKSGLEDRNNPGWPLLASMRRCRSQ